MKIIKVSYIVHRNERRIRLYFEADTQLNNLLKKITGSRWSKTLKCWHLPCSKTVYRDFKKMLPPLWEVVEIKDTDKPSVKKEPCVVTIIRPPVYVKKTQIIKPEPPKILPANLQALRKFIETLELKAYSESTIRTYRNEFSALLQVLKTRVVGSLTADEVKRYILYCINELRLSENTIHSRLNALKFYFEQVLNRVKIFVEIPRPKKRLILPKILGEQEIGRLFRALENKKHKAILFTAYSAGLRVSETVNLQIKDIDPDRMQILVENSKGKKDRYVMLSPVLLDILRNYLKSCKPRPIKYLFEGATAGEPLASRTAQHIFHEAKEKAGIHKQLSFHSLRHSFATHLLENGVDIKYIKDLLGHFNINTTTRYLHVKREMLVNIKSPLDEIYKSGNMDF
ncbi:MAG: site-specific integrase [Ferruginibacter sp.]|nr:site-specific integrase [Ferruginibacter sp.]